MKLFRGGGGTIINQLFIKILDDYFLVVEELLKAEEEVVLYEDIKLEGEAIGGNRRYLSDITKQCESHRSRVIPRVVSQRDEELEQLRFRDSTELVNAEEVQTEKLIHLHCG